MKPPPTERDVTGALRNRHFWGEPLSPLTLSLVAASFESLRAWYPQSCFVTALAGPALRARFLLLSPRGCAAGVLLLPPRTVSPASSCPRQFPSPCIPRRACLLWPARAPRTSFSRSPPGGPVRRLDCVSPKENVLRCTRRFFGFSGTCCVCNVTVFFRLTRWPPDRTAGLGYPDRHARGLARTKPPPCRPDAPPGHVCWWVLPPKPLGFNPIRRGKRIQNDRTTASTRPMPLPLDVSRSWRD